MPVAGPGAGMPSPLTKEAWGRLREAQTTQRIRVKTRKKKHRKWGHYKPIAFGESLNWNALLH